jgi:hypothetical protein
MRQRAMILLCAGLLACTWEESNPNVVRFSSDDPEMRAAIHGARAWAPADSCRV